MVQALDKNYASELKIQLNSRRARIHRTIMFDGVPITEPSCWIFSKLTASDYDAVDRLIRKTLIDVESYGIVLLSSILDATRIMPHRIPSRSSLLQAVRTTEFI